MYATTPFLKLYRCFCRGLKMCMWFGYNPQINLCHFFRILNLVILYARMLSKCIDSGHRLCVTPPTVLCRSFWNIIGAFSRGLKMCILFGYNPQINFCHFFRILNLVIFQARIPSKCTVYLVCATPPTVLCQSVGIFTCVLSWSKDVHYMIWV